MHNLGSAAIACGAIASISIAAASASPPSSTRTTCLGSAIALQHGPLPDSVECSRLVSLETIPPSSTFSATVEPSTIQLGETLTVRIQLPADSPAPTVSFGDRQFPVFPFSTQANSEAQEYRALVPSSPLDTPGSHTISVAAGESQQTLPVTLRARTFPTQSITIGSGGLQATQTELDAVSRFKSISSPTRYWNGPFLRPSGGRVSSIYGVRRYYNGVFASDYYHRGVDYAAPFGAPIVAPAAGKIALVGREAEGFAVHGNTVGIDHGQGVVSIFLHLNQISVEEGQEVDAGQQVGTIGTSGASTGPHLHWGLFVHEVAVDPVPWRYEGLE